jgi:broad specificity phosphatase PhoE
VSAVARWTERHAGETILIASHGLVFRALAESLVGKKLYSRNAEPYYFRPVDDEWVVSAVSV